MFEEEGEELGRVDGYNVCWGYDVWSENATETLNYPISTYGGRHFKPQDTEVNDQSKIAHVTRGETFQTPTSGDRQPYKGLEQVYLTNTQ